MTTDEIHGHEILDIIESRPQGISVEDLTQLAAQRFGPDVLFCTCSAGNMDLPSLLAFLLERDKIQQRDGRLFPGGSPACNHDHP